MTKNYPKSSGTGLAYLNGELVNFSEFFASPEFYDKWLMGELDLSEPTALAPGELKTTSSHDSSPRDNAGDVMPGWLREAGSSSHTGS